MTLGDLRLAVRIAATIPVVWLRVRLLPLPKALSLGSRLPAPGSRRGTTADRSSTSGHLPQPGAGSREPGAEHLIRLTDRILALRVAYLRPSCLLRSLVLFRFLREAGVPVQIHFGVAREGDALKGHAWLTLDGLPYAEATDPSTRFHVVYSFP